MHFFLTGDICVGKTTIINRYLAHTGIRADGFATYWIRKNDNRRDLYISPYTTDKQNDTRRLIVSDTGQRPLFSPEMTRVFDNRGSEILNNSGKRDIIVMDEIGYLESASALFQRSVMRHVHGDIPILGVLKPIQTDFLDLIRTHPNVKIIEVTVQNREAVLAWFLEREQLFCGNEKAGAEYIKAGFA